MKKWLRDNSNEIVAATSVLGVLVGIIGFAFTVWQLRTTTDTLRASNTYDIQRDARELAENIQDNGFIPKLVAGTLPAEERGKAHVDGWKMFNFYLAVYRQSQAGGVSPEFERAFIVDFCDTVQKPAIDDLWAEMIKAKRLSKYNTAMREQWCNGK
jgi:hypothetical protein